MNSYNLDNLKPYYVQQPVSPWSEMPWVAKVESIVLLILVILGILALLASEYRAHDCIPGKECNHKVPKPTQDDNNLQYVDKIKEMVVNNYQYISWRLSLLTGLIITLPIIYFLKGRIPTLIEWLIVGGLVFLITYLALSWIWAHFFHPNGLAIEDHLTNLRDRIHKLEIETKSQSS